MLKDIRYAIRTLIKTPAVTCVAIVTLALGIGANTAIFSGVSAFILRDIAVTDANRLVRPVETGDDGRNDDEISYPDFVEYRNQTTSFTGISGEDMLQVAIDTQDQNDVIWGQEIGRAL